jgi:hypothetical protein
MSPSRSKRFFGQLRESSEKSYEQTSPASTSASFAYQYQPLDVQSKEIRLVDLQPAQNRRDPIHCKIRHVKLNAPGEFIALSYAWGDTMNKRPIFVNGRKLLITRNLEQFFRETHVSENEQTFWIDAVCINQNNLAERSSQVQIMKEIYSAAIFVLVWLGLKDENSERAFDLIYECYTVAQTALAVPDINQQRTNISAWISSQTSPLFETCSWLAVADLLNRPWWSRAWIVQEIVMAKNALFKCGDFVLPWDYFLLVSTAIINYLGAISRIAVGSYNSSTHPVETDLFLSRFSRLSGGAGRVRAIATTKYHGVGDKSSYAFYDILRQHMMANATDPRDKIYAFLGLAAKEHTEAAKVPVDYTIHPADLYRTVTISHLETKRALYILNECYGIGRPNGFSSWCPRFNELAWKPAGDIRFMDYPPHLIFDATGDMKAEFHFTEDNLGLLIASVRVDTVKAIGSIFAHRVGETVDGMEYTLENIQKSWGYLAAGLKKSSIGPQKISDDEEIEAWIHSGLYPTGISNHEAFTRTFLGNPKADLNTNYYNPLNGLDADQRMTNVTLDPDGMNDAHMRGRMGLMCDDRRFYVTSQGYYGLGPPVTQIGDVVCVFLGGKIPFLLRPQGNVYEIVSESYVQGLMSGEVFTLVQEGRLSVETIHLI